MGSVEADNYFDKYQAPTHFNTSRRKPLARKKITTRDILENSATLASAIYTTNSPHAHPKILIDWLEDTKPHGYYNIAKHCLKYCNKHSSISEFSESIVRLCDLALFGCFLPGMDGFGLASTSWDDIHPTHRLTQILRTIDKHRCFQTALFHNHNLLEDIPHIAIIDDIFTYLRLPKKSDQVLRIDWDMLTSSQII